MQPIPARIAPPPNFQSQQIPKPSFPPMAIQTTAKGDEPRTFSLDFRGGSPRELADAISKALHSHLNVIISEENNTIQIPPIKVENVTVYAFMEALKRASQSSVNISGCIYDTSYGFDTGENNDHAIWYFRVNRPRIVEPPTVCRYYQLEPHLKKLPIQSILNAINTGFEMMQITNPPQLRFQPETKLLIVVGKNDHQRVVESALDQLRTFTKPEAGIPAGTPALAPRRIVR
jgi:hypothetical protein